MLGRDKEEGNSEVKGHDEVENNSEVSEGEEEGQIIEIEGLGRVRLITRTTAELEESLSEEPDSLSSYRDFACDVEAFVNNYGITTFGQRAAETEEAFSKFKVSADVFEETLLRLAGVTTKPNGCKYNPSGENDLKFEIKGLKPEDDALFATFLGLTADKVTHDEAASVFTLPIQTLRERILPLFKARVESDFTQSRDVLRPYFHPYYILNRSMHGFAMTANSMNNASNKTLRADFDKIADDYLMAQRFYLESDRVFGPVSHEPLLDVSDDVQKFMAKYSAELTPSMLKNLTEMHKFIDLFVFTVRPVNAVKDTRPCDAAGQRMRFFDRPITDNILRAHTQSAEVEKAEEEVSKLRIG